jgi:hypothetical protein
MHRAQQIHDRFRRVGRHRVQMRTPHNLQLTDHRVRLVIALWVTVPHDLLAIGRMRTAHHVPLAIGRMETAHHVPLATDPQVIANHLVTDRTPHVLPASALQ